MDKTSYICSTCGIQYPPTANPPTVCKICSDERQYINPNGQSWTTLPFINKHHRNVVEKLREDLYAIYTTPSFGIGQRAHLLLTPDGNILWDCISNIDDSTVDLLNRLGGVNAIAISHPHYYSSVAEWSARFDDAPVYIHAKDEQWLGRIDFNLILWHREQKELWEHVKLVNCGGHFDGASILHYNLNDGLLLVGDVIQVCPDLKSVSFMYSYPNYIPLPKKDILQIAKLLSKLKYASIYGAFGHYLLTHAAMLTEQSINRYLRIY
ncbi:MBL fold metallo-hydrolase [Olivibacter sp. SDN3]|uniref:MBL fold metallo-hydrolase n=1 Tax=Olivibacter sp. SDN3 TaxID=2764720 RepID=UPI0016510AAB|nr:MBL fold metallo-hydrolase [Olivibacter sp. SDN3]QNL49054.1 MBL fold metallo-hydrolase [Olivibacter sp. SDN3]